MSLVSLAMSIAGVVLSGTLLAALIWRQRYVSCYTFLLYVTAVFVPALVFLIWPQYYTWENYFLKEVVHNLLKFAIALELAYRTFRAFPGAMHQGRRMVLAILVLVAFVVILGVSGGSPTHAAKSVEWHARVLNGTVWLLTGIAATILWYRLPVDSFHKAILVGFVPYLLLFSIGMRAMLEMGQAQSALIQRAHGTAYFLLLAYWNRTAWATAPTHHVIPAGLRGSQPETA